MRLVTAVALGAFYVFPALAQEKPVDVLTPAEREKAADFEAAKKNGLKPVSIRTKEFDTGDVKTAEFKSICRQNGKGPVSLSGSVKTLKYANGTIRQFICTDTVVDDDTKKRRELDGEFSEIHVALKGYKRFSFKGRDNGEMAIADGLLYVDRHGCCGEGGYLNIYDLKTGKIKDKEILIAPFINEVTDRLPSEDE